MPAAFPTVAQSEDARVLRGGGSRWPKGCAEPAVTERTQGHDQLDSTQRSGRRRTICHSSHVLQALPDVPPQPPSRLAPGMRPGIATTPERLRRTAFGAGSDQARPPRRMQRLRKSRDPARDTSRQPLRVVTPSPPRRSRRGLTFGSAQPIDQAIREAPQPVSNLVIGSTKTPGPRSPRCAGTRLPASRPPNRLEPTRRRRRLLWRVGWNERLRSRSLPWPVALTLTPSGSRPSSSSIAGG